MFVKICGITSEEDALLSVAMGADAVGFVFAPSPRLIAPARAADIAKRLPPEILTVGVFRNEAPARVIQIVGSTGLKAAQLHGHETADECREIAMKVPVLIKAFPAGHEGLRRSDDYGTDIILIDSNAPGSGEMFDWALAEGAPSHRRLILAGGLTPDNVTEAIARVKPWGVDVSSGVESEPGRKDARKVQAFINAARAAEPHGYEGSDDRPFDWMEDDD